jgi:hypothetical protein
VRDAAVTPEGDLLGHGISDRPTSFDYTLDNPEAFARATAAALTDSRCVGRAM